MSLFFWAGPRRPSDWMPSTAHMQHPILGNSPVCALLDRRPLLMEPRSYRTPTASTTSPPSLLSSPHVNIRLDPPSPCFFFRQGIISHLSPLRLPLCFSIFSELFFQVEHTINFPIALCCQVYISPLDSAAHITGFDATAPKPFSASPTPESLDEPPLPYACPAGSTDLTGPVLVLVISPQGSHHPAPTGCATPSALGAVTAHALVSRRLGRPVAVG
jgi:hypothetical protein